MQCISHKIYSILHTASERNSLIHGYSKSNNIIYGGISKRNSIIVDPSRNIIEIMKSNGLMPRTNKANRRWKKLSLSLKQNEFILDSIKDGSKKTQEELLLQAISALTLDKSPSCEPNDKTQSHGKDNNNEDGSQDSDDSSLASFPSDEEGDLDLDTLNNHSISMMMQQPPTKLDRLRRHLKWSGCGEPRLKPSEANVAEDRRRLLMTLLRRMGGGLNFKKRERLKVRAAKQLEMAFDRAKTFLTEQDEVIALIG